MNNGSITASRNELAAAVTYAATAISARPATPVLTGMSVIISGGWVTFGSFDYETCVTAQVHGTDYEGGSVLVNGADLVAAVKSMPPGKRTVATLTVTSDTRTGPEGEPVT